MYAKAKVSMEQRRTGMLACVERIYGQSVREEHNLIKVEHVKKSFKEKEVLKDITFEFLPDRTERNGEDDVHQYLVRLYAAGRGYDLFFGRNG